MAKKKEELDGVWRTIGGRRVFIRKGQDLSSAMKESGKFKTKMNEKAVKGVREEDLKDQYIESLNNVSKMEYNGEITRDEYDEAIKNINKEYKKRKMGDKFYTREDGTKEYDPYKGTPYEKKYDSMDEVIKDPESAFNKYIDSKMPKESGVRTLDGSYEKDNKGRVVTQKEYEDFRQAYRDGKISKEDYKNDNYGALKKDEEIESSIKSLYIYKDEKGMGSLEKDPLKRYYDKYGKENVDRVWKQMDKKYDVIKGTSIDTEGLRYNNLIEKDKYNPEAIQKYKNATKRAWENYYGDSRKYNEEVGRAREEFERSKKSDYDHFAGWELYSDDPNRYGDIVRKYNERNALKDRYQGTYNYLQSTTNMSGAEILELLKKIDEDRK